MSWIANKFKKITQYFKDYFEAEEEMYKLANSIRENKNDSSKYSKYVEIVCEFTETFLVVFKVLSILDELVREPIDEHKSSVKSCNISGMSIL